MSNGDQQNVLQRLWKEVPPWFPNPAPVANAILSGMASIFSATYAQAMFVKTQMRIPTSVGQYLDLTGYDFFGDNFPRLPGQTDASYAAAIVKEIFRERVTRKGIWKAITDTTGGSARIFEPFNVKDTGGYGYNMYYAYRGKYGNRKLSGQFFVDVETPKNQGTTVCNGYGGKFSGYGQGLGCYINNSQQIGPIDQASLSQVILNTKAAGTVLWARFVPPLEFQAPNVLCDPSGAMLVSDAGEVLVLSLSIPEGMYNG